MITQLRPVGKAVFALPLMLALGVAPVTEPNSSTPNSSTPNSSTSGPIVSSSKPEVATDGTTVLTIDGFVSPYVTISVCGNEARRGSADCNMSASEGVEVSGDAPLVIQMPIAAPSVDCPCVIRVVGKDSSEVAVTPVEIIGHPVGPLVDPPVFGDLVAVSISAHEVPRGALDALRSALGGKTNFQVTVRVKNLTTAPLKQVSLSASAGRSENDDSLVSLALEDPGLIGVGQTWQQTIMVVIPAPAFGSTEWRAAVSGAGQTVIGTSTTKHRPWLLIILVMVVVFNIGLLLMRWRIRRRARLEAAAAATADSPAEVAADDMPADEIVAAAAERAREFISSGA